MIGLRIGQRPFDESGSPSSSTEFSGMRDANKQAAAAANIVRVAAKTALPIVSSVPKCRRSKASRSHPMETVNGASSGSSRLLLSSQVRPLIARGASGGGRSAQVGGELAMNGANRMMMSKQPLETDQVLLIVNDDHIKGGGVPIIGRRLPSKSAALTARSNPASLYPQHHRHPSTDCLIVSTATGERSQPVAAPMSAAAPVIGRRSHRMIQQTQQQQQQQQQQQVGTIYPYYCHDYPQLQQSGVELTTSSPIDNVRPTNKTQAHYKQQPLSIIETQSYHNQQVEQQLAAEVGGRDSGAAARRRYSNNHNRHQQQTNASSLMNLNESSSPLIVDEYFLPPMEKTSSSRRLLAGSKPSIQSSSGQRNKLHHQVSQSSSMSSTCSPMCSIQASVSSAHYLDDYHQVPPCCSAQNCGEDVAEYSESPPCCRPFESSSEQVCTLACCASSPIKTKSPSSCHKSHIHHHHHHHSRQAKSGDNLHQSSRSHRQVARSSLHHHSTCQANGDSSQPLLLASGKPSAAYRSSSCHDPRRVGQQQQQQVAMQLINARCNVLPVHPKPKVLNYLGGSPSRAPAGGDGLYLIERNSITSGSFQSGSQSNCSGTDDPTVVTQMYESLAAELKAKLGDPKLAPILLPPKDYDTMSRKQGKLTGIELRRSTNPQLVGPAAHRPANNCGESAKVGCGTTGGSRVVEQQVADNRSVLNKQAACKGASSAGCGSSRSSGRSSGHDEPRSRSNSSSGLGSISIEAESPSSSKVSSNEDMRQASCQSRLLANNGNFTCVSINNNNNQQTSAGKDDQVTKIGAPQVDRKNPSPNGSDSGHSGSARLDGGEEQKSILLGTADQFYGSTFDSTPSPSINSHNSNNNSNTPEDTGAASSTWSETKVEAGRGAGIHNHNPSKVSSGVLWNGRVEVPLKVNSAKNGNTYLATKQIIY